MIKGIKFFLCLLLLYLQLIMHPKYLNISDLRSSFYIILNMKKCTLLLFLICFIWAIPQSFAQRYTRNKRYISVGGSINAMNYFGDITPSSSFSSADLRFTRPNFSVHMQRKYTPRLSARAAFAWGRLKGDDFISANPADRNGRYRYVRNAHFRNDIKELSLVGIWDLFENRNTFLRRPEFVPYIFAGIAVFHHNPRARTPEEDGRKWVALQPLGTEGQFIPDQNNASPYKRIQMAIPAGVGVRYKLSPRIDLGFEIGYRFTFFDYLDDVSGNYPDMGDLRTASGEMAVKMSNRTLENIAANTGESRESTLNRILNDTGLGAITYVGSDGNLYDTVNGYGMRDDQRGKPSEKDWYLVTGFQINYILIKGVRCPRFR